MTKYPEVKNARTRSRELYLKYKKRGFFNYVVRSVLTIILLYTLFMLIFFLVGRYLIDFNGIFISILKRLSDQLVLAVFFISESFLGLVPVDFFVIWAQQFEQPLVWLILLGVLSYAGSVLSYIIGRWIWGRPKIRAYTEKNLSQYMDFARKWGGAFIVIAALFPFTPFSMVVIALALLNYPFKYFLLFALTRLVRFLVQGILIFNILQLQNWIV